MTNKKFKKAAMALALTACVAATPLAANAETPENAVPVENKERSEAETPAQQASESANTAPVENQEHENAEGILEDRETEDKKITTDVEYTDREFTYNKDGTVKSEESSGDIVQKEMDKSTEAASGETAGEGKDSEGSAETPEAGETTEEGKGIKAPDADISEPVKDAEGKIIGTASKEERTEQETTITPTSPDSEKLVDSTVNPDGSVTNRYETSHAADKTTTNTTTGTVTADTKEIFVTDGKEVDLKQELGKDYQKKLKWDTVDGTSFNGYTVGSMEEDGDRQTYTLTKHTEDTDLEMTGEDLAKLLEADYTKTENDDGSYTLTKSIRTSAGEQTVYITVTGNKATRTVDTTLKVDVKKSEHTGSAEVKQDDVTLPNKTDKTLTFTDKDNNTFSVDLDELLQKQDKTESTNAAGDKVITVKDGSKTYEIVYHETSEYADAQVKDMSADELAKLLNSNPGNGTFTVKDGKVCKVVNGEACEISYDDASQLLKKVQISVTMTDADNQLSKDNGTLEDAELRAKKAALQKALAEAIEACTGTKVDPASLTLTDEDVSFPRVTWEAWDLGEIRNEEQADDQWTISSGKDESGGLTYTIVDKKNNVTYDDLIRVGSNSYTKTVTDENGVKTTYTITVEPGNLDEDMTLAKLAERYGVEAAAITVKDGVASFTKDGKQYQVGYGSQLKIETVLTTEGTVTTDADQAELLEKIQQMQKDLQDGEILDVGGYQVTISTSKDEIIEILHKVGETTDFTRLTREELKALLEKEKAEADAAGKSYTGDMDVSHPEYSNKNLYGRPDTGIFATKKKEYLSYDGNYIQHLELNATTKADLLKDADGNVSQTDCVLVDKKLEYSDDLDKLIDSQGTSVVNLQDKIGYDIPMDRYEYARTSFSDGDKLNWNVRNNHPTASTYYKVSGTVAYNQYKLEDGTSELTKEQAEALLKQLQAEGYADASIVTFYTTEHEHQQTERNASYRIYLNKSELISYGYLSYDSNTCTNAHNWNQAMYGLSKNKYFNSDAYCGGYDLGLTGFRQVEDGTFVAQGKKTITVSRILPATTLTNNHLTITDSAQKADTGSGVSGRYNYTTTVSGSRVNYSALGTATHETWKEAAQQTTERTGEQVDGTLSYTYRSTQDASVDAESAHKEETVVRHGTADYEYTYTASKDEVEITTDSRTETTTPETPETPDTPVSPEGPTTPPVQDATPDDAETPVTPENPANPSVQDATPDTVAALPKTGVNWTAALAMALSGMALTVAGAFTSLFAKSKH